MSTKIGIVSEGISDYWALKHIVERYLKEYDVHHSLKAQNHC